MTYDMIELTRQVQSAHWGWTIGFFLWFVGLGGMSLFINAWLKSRSLFWVATASVWLGTLLVLSHLSRLLNLPIAGFTALMEGSFNFGSWMFVGICILAVTCVWTGVQGLLIVKRSACPLVEARWSFCVGATLGVLATVYSGFLLTQAVGVPFWTTAVLPALWLVSGLACALSAAEGLALLGRLDSTTRGWTQHAERSVHLVEALLLFALVSVAFSGTPGAVASAHALISGSEASLFWGGAVVLGILLPLGLETLRSKWALGLGAIATIFGALFLRTSVLLVGTFDPTWLG